MSIVLWSSWWSELKSDADAQSLTLLLQSDVFTSIVTPNLGHLNLVSCLQVFEQLDKPINLIRFLLEKGTLNVVSAIIQHKQPKLGAAQALCALTLLMPM